MRSARVGCTAQTSLFAPAATRDWALAVAKHMGLALSPLEEREFEDGEHKSRPLCSVRGSDVYVLQSLHADSHASVNDKLCRLLFLLGALRDASAARITAVVPYLGYARKDRKSQPRDPVTTRYVAAMFEAVGADRIVTLDVHNLSAYQNAFRCHTDRAGSPARRQAGSCASPAASARTSRTSRFRPFPSASRPAAWSVGTDQPTASCDPGC